MVYRLNNIVPAYLYYSDYNLKNVHLEVKRKVYGRKCYKIYRKRLIEGIYKFGFYKDIINGELAVIDSGIKRIQVMKDEISGKDFNLTVSWIFATKYLERQTDVFGYEYRSIYNLRLLSLAMLRLENRNKNLRDLAKNLNLRPSFRLSLNKRVFWLSSIILRKKKRLESLLIKFLRIWHSGSISASRLKFFRFFINKTKKRLKAFSFLYFYYRLRHIKIFESLFVPVKAFAKRVEPRLCYYVKKPPYWMLKRFGLRTRKKWVKGLYWNYYVNSASGLWNLAKPVSAKRSHILNDFKEDLQLVRDKRRAILVAAEFPLSFLRFFSFLYRNRKFHPRQKRFYSIWFFALCDFYIQRTSGLKHVFYSSLFSEFMRLVVNGSNLFNKRFLYEGFLLFVIFTLQFRKFLFLFSKWSYLGFFELYRFCVTLPSKFLDVFFYRERLFLYNLGSDYSVDGVASYFVPLLKRYFVRFSRKAIRTFKHFAWKTNRRNWRLNRKYSWFWRKKFILRRFRRRLRQFKRVPRLPSKFFFWLNKRRRLHFYRVPVWDLRVYRRFPLQSYKLRVKLRLFLRTGQNFLKIGKPYVKTRKNSVIARLISKKIAKTPKAGQKLLKMGKPYPKINKNSATRMPASSRIMTDSKLSPGFKSINKSVVRVKLPTKREDGSNRLYHNRIKKPHASTR